MRLNKKGQRMAFNNPTLLGVVWRLTSKICSQFKKNSKTLINHSNWVLQLNKVVVKLSFTQLELSLSEKGTHSNSVMIRIDHKNAF